MAQLLHQDNIHFFQGFHPLESGWRESSVTQHSQTPSTLLLYQELQAES